MQINTPVLVGWIVMAAVTAVGWWAVVNLIPWFMSQDEVILKLAQATQREARLREALKEIIEKCEDEDWEYMFGDIITRAKQALKDTGDGSIQTDQEETRL